MKNKILKLSLMATLLLSLSSCRLLFNISNENTNTSNNHSLEYKFTESDKTAINNRITELNTLISNGNDYQKFYNAYIRVVKGDLYSVATYRNLAQLNYSILADSTSREKYSEANEYLNTLVEWEESLYKKIYNSKFRDEFFKNYTKEEIDSLVGTSLPKEYYDLENENDKLLAQYDAISDPTTSSEVPVLYRKLVENYKLQASYYGYTDYRDFAYKELYDRDFDSDNALQFSNYVREYIVPLFENKTNSFNNKYQNASSKYKTTVSSFIAGSYKNYMDYFDEYAKEIGGSYYLAYNNLWNNGYYFMGKSSSSDGAYTLYLYNLSTPACYFGPNYQNISTLVHEFGHYYSMLERGNGSGSLDLAETQSQGNELLFLAYLDSNNKFLPETLSMIRDYKLSEALQTIVLANLVNDFENTIYSTDNLSLIDFDNLFINVCDKYGGYYYLKEIFGGDFSTYWRRVALDNPLYYISYSVSLIPAIGLYQAGMKDFNSASDSYNKIVFYDYQNMSFLDVLDAAGLYNPFVENSFKELSKLYE